MLMSSEILTEMYIKLSKRKNLCTSLLPTLGQIARLGVSIYAEYGTDSIPCANVSANQSNKLSDNLEPYRTTKFIARLFINITVFKNVCKRVSFVV